MRWKTAHIHLLALACVLRGQQPVQAAYSPAIVRIDAGSSNGQFIDAGGNLWSSDSNYSSGVQLPVFSVSLYIYCIDAEQALCPGLRALPTTVPGLLRWL